MDGISNERVIHRYSRAEAIADGQLVDITRWTTRAGIIYPVAVSIEVWSSVTEPDNPLHISLLGRFVAMLRDEMRRGSGDWLAYSHEVDLDGLSKSHALYVTLLPGDELEPVVTVTMNDED